MTDEQTDERTNWVTTSLLELLIAAKNLRNCYEYQINCQLSTFNYIKHIGTPQAQLVLIFSLVLLSPGVLILPLVLWSSPLYSYLFPCILILSQVFLSYSPILKSCPMYSYLFPCILILSPVFLSTSPVSKSCPLYSNLVPCILISSLYSNLIPQYSNLIPRYYYLAPCILILFSVF